MFDKEQISRIAITLKGHKLIQEYCPFHDNYVNKNKNQNGLVNLPIAKSILLINLTLRFL